MGFEAARVDWALRETRNAGLQPALDFLFAHTDDAIPAAGAASSSSRGAMEVDEDPEDEEAIRAALGKGSADIAPVQQPDAVAQSIKCMVCDKIFRDTGLANFHAEKSGHDQFEESTDEVCPPWRDCFALELSRFLDQAVDRRGEAAETPRATGEDGRQTREAKG